MRSFTVLFAMTAILAGCAAADDAENVAVRVEKQQVRFQVGQEVAATYQKDARFDKPFFSPVLGPNGERMTRPGLADYQLGDSLGHPHQNSVWAGHGAVTLKGQNKPVDFWLDGKKKGKIVCVDVGEPKGNAIVTKNEWRAPDGTKMLDETRTIRFTIVDKNTRLLEVDMDLHASVGDIVFGDTKECFFGIRVNDQLREKGGSGVVTNSEKQNGSEKCWGRKALWCDCSGKINGKEVGIALLDHPDNSFPARWHVRDYGLVAANPFGREGSGFQGAGKEAAILAKGKHFKFRYGILIHQGDASNVAKPYDRFSGR